MLEVEGPRLRLSAFRALGSGSARIIGDRCHLRNWCLVVQYLWLVETGRS